MTTPSCAGRWRPLLEPTDAGDAGSAILQRPAFDVHAKDPALGRDLGPYHLVELLDRGGMGTVYRAQRSDFDKQVALKLIRRGLDADGALVRRFHNERQILARLEHPHIAHLLDGGTTEDHLPYFVMELVDGQPLDHYCKTHDLGIEARLRLFQKVCSAVHFAHQNLVIHRDLKPDNVLITEDGEPKLLDFGIAKLLDDSLAAEPVATVADHAPMTPRYASPEQIQRGTISTASDIYTLGVLLYELLAGVDPYGADRLRPDEVSRAICEQEPPRPSTAVKRLEDVEAPVLRKLRRRLSGDLDSIVLKAMRKEPGQRYGSAEDLSRDIQRHLDGQPVLARPGTASYRTGKFVRRHWVGVLAAIGFFLLGTGFGISSTILRIQDQREREIAVETAQRALDAQELERLKRREDEAFSFVLRVFDPSQLPVGITNPTPTQYLDVAKKRALELEDRELQIIVLSKLGLFYRQIGNKDAASETLYDALERCWQYFPEGFDQLAQVESNFITVATLDQEDHRSAIDSYLHLLALRIENGQEGAELWKLRSNLATAFVMQGDFQQAESIFENVLKGRLEIYDEDDRRLIPSYLNLGALHFASGEMAEARRFVDKALAIPLPPENSGSYNSLKTLRSIGLNLSGKIFTSEGRTEVAVQSFTAAMSLRHHGNLPSDQKAVAIIKKNMAAALIERDPEEAHRLLDEAIPVLEANLPTSWLVADAKSIRGALLLQERNYVEGEPLLRSACDDLSRIRGANSYVALIACDRLDALKQKFEMEDALPHLLHPDLR